MGRFHKSVVREVWEYLTYDVYGRRRPRPVVYGLLAAVGLILLFVVGGWGLGRGAPAAAPQSMPTLPPPTKTAIAATATARVPPTPTAAPVCPTDPVLWKLEEVSPGWDPQTGKPIRLPKPLYRIEPPCVYEGFWRDVAGDLFLTRTDAPSVKKWVEAPWYWNPGLEIIKRPFSPRPGKRDVVSLLYDREGRRVDDVLTAYTALPTGDPDFPLVLYLYQDAPGAAYLVRWEGGKEAGRIATIRPVRLSGGSVLRTVDAFLYDARQRRWYGAYIKKSADYPRILHVVDADGSRLWEMLGVRGYRRSELAKAFGMQEFFPERIDWKAFPMGEELTFEP
ncbi:MAG TPA: hypothetical protein VNK89_12560 [Thermoflexus sp.]|nr:hypothetical protein [Thermoflexus sp.]